MATLEKLLGIEDSKQAQEHISRIEHAIEVQDYRMITEETWYLAAIVRDKNINPEVYDGEEELVRVHDKLESLVKLLAEYDAN